MATHDNAHAIKAPAPKDARRADVLETVAEFVSGALETADAPTGTHSAPLGGMDLLIEIAKLAEQVLATRAPSNQPHRVEPVDPRRCVDPRKRILPR